MHTSFSISKLPSTAYILSPRVLHSFLLHTVAHEKPLANTTWAS